MNNFLIASTGRTATKWLAHTMNKSIKWTVFHEPRGFKNDSFSFAEYTYKNPFYAEISGSLMYDFDKFKCKKAIIVRNYKEHLLSLANRYDYTTFIEHIVSSKRLYSHIDKIEKKVIIDFYKMTTDLEYLKRLFVWCGITDYIPTQKDLSNKINATKEWTYNHYNTLPETVRNLVKSLDFKNIAPNF